MIYTIEDMRSAYIAGLMDGEGFLGLSRDRKTLKDGKQKDYFYPIVRVGMKAKNTIYMLREMTGVGKVYASKDGVYVWVVRGDEGRELLLDVTPYLINKKTQAETLIAAWDEEDPIRMEAYYWKCRLLKKLGV